MHLFFSPKKTHLTKFLVLIRGALTPPPMMLDPVM